MRHPDRPSPSRPGPGRLLAAAFLVVVLASAGCDGEGERGGDGEPAPTAQPAAAIANPVDFDREGFVRDRLAGHYATGLGLVRPEERPWRFALGGAPAILGYEIPGVGISGRVLLVAGATEPRAVLEGFTGRIRDSTVTFEVVAAAGRSFQVATVVTAPITLRFAACRRGEDVLLFQHLADAEVAAGARADALAFLGALREFGPGESEVVAEGGRRMLRARPSGTTLPLDLLAEDAPERDLLSEDGLETIPFRDTSLVRSVPDRLLDDRAPPAVLRALFAAQALPETLTAAAEPPGGIWTGRVLHEDAAALYALRRIGSIWQGLRVSGTDIKEVSRRFDDLIPYLRDR